GRIEVFQSFEFDFYAWFLLADLFEQHLAEVFCYSAWFSSTGHAIEGYSDAFIVLDCAFEGCDLDIWRYTMRHLLQQSSPVETPINECVERYVRRYSKAAPQATLSETNACWRFLRFAAGNASSQFSRGSQISQGKPSSSLRVCRIISARDNPPET